MTSRPQWRMSPLPGAEARVDKLASAMARFELKPSYQRQSNVWGEEKRQLFLDSLINGYDVPKLYFHRLPVRAAPEPAYAIVDGKQRLEAIRFFLDDAFPLSEDFSDVEGSGASAADAAGKTYSQLTSEHPALAARLMRRQLDIVVVETTDIEVIEELFSRLNEAVPLNAPEKRNAFGGPLPPIIRELVGQNEFFSDRLPIENTRYKQLDIATKFLFLTERGEFASTKKKALDDFVKGYRDLGAKEGKKAADKLAKGVESVLADMSSVFDSQDELLTSVGLVTVYFMAFLLAQADQSLRAQLKRERLLAFDDLRRQNRGLLMKYQAAVAQGQEPKGAKSVRQDLAIFDRLMQSPNDGQALEFRFRILRSYLKSKTFRESLPPELAKRLPPA
jgi:hypothetical protein